MRLLRRISLSILLGASFLAAQTVVEADAMYARMRIVGDKLKCQCGCSYTIGSCNMLHCSFREKVNPQIRASLEAGLPVAAIVERMIEEAKELQRQEASRIVVPGRDTGGKITLS